MTRELRYYLILLNFRMKEPFSDIRATGITYFLYCFFIWLLSMVWARFNSAHSFMTHSQVFLYIGVTELFFMSFLSARSITGSTEDFALFLARPRSWAGREIAANIGSALGKRIMFAITLIVFSLLLGRHPTNYLGFISRIAFLIAVLALPQALVSSLFSSLRLSFPQTDYFILPFGKLFLALGGVFGPLSDYGEPWRSVFLKLPGSDLFFQPGYFAVTGDFFQTSGLSWFGRVCVIDAVLLVLLYYFYQRGRRVFQAWGG